MENFICNQCGERFAIFNTECVLQQISYAFPQRKNVENRLRFDKVTDRLKVGTVLRHSVNLNRNRNVGQCPT